MKKAARPPPVTGLVNLAIFLDFDGTLVEIAPSPNEIEVDPLTLITLETLFRKFDGALAIITGRKLEDIDTCLFPLILPAAGIHGVERRSSNGSIHTPAHDAKLSQIKKIISEYSKKNFGVFLEDKGQSLAVHYRMAPDKEKPIKLLLSKLTRNRDDLQILSGKMVYEVKPVSINKGTAIEAFMTEIPFKNRTPLFVGDDQTDEDAFKYVNKIGGLSVRVGTEGTSLAKFRLQNVVVARKWLSAISNL